MVVATDLGKPRLKNTDSNGIAPVHVHRGKHLASSETFIHIWNDTGAMSEEQQLFACICWQASEWTVATAVPVTVPPTGETPAEPAFPVAPRCLDVLHISCGVPVCHSMFHEHAAD